MRLRETIFVLGVALSMGALLSLGLLSSCGKPVSSDPPKQKCNTYAITNNNVTTIYGLYATNASSAIINLSSMQNFNVKKQSHTASRTFDNTLAGFHHFYFYSDSSHTMEIGKLIILGTPWTATHVCTIEIGSFNDNPTVIHSEEGTIYCEGKMQPHLSQTDIDAPRLDGPTVKMPIAHQRDLKLAAPGFNLWYYFCFYDTYLPPCNPPLPQGDCPNYNKLISKFIFSNTNTGKIKIGPIQLYGL